MKASDRKLSIHPGILCGVIALAALFAAFVLPFCGRGTQQPIYSATYPVGAENHAATVTLALLSLLVLLWTAWRAPTAPHPPNQTAPPLTAATALLGASLVALWTLALAWAVAHAHIRYGESAYFLERMRDMAASSGRLYSDLEFPYGPLLLLPPVWLARVGVPLVAGYFASLLLLNVAGILMTAYVLNRLSLGHAPRLLLFWLFCLEQLHPLAGANYSLGKFMLPFAVLLWGIARASLATRFLALAAGVLLVILVSPELGVGLAAAVAGWAVVTAFATRRASSLVLCLAPPLAYAAFIALYGRGFLDRLAHASAGALNLVIEPLPHVFVLLAALIFLAPLAVGRRLRMHPQGPLLCGVYLLSLGLLPGALGRSDPLHVFFNGFGFLLLSFVGLERFGRRSAWLWTAAVALLCLQVQATNFAIYQGPLKDLADALHHPPPTADFDNTQLAQTTGGEPVATPALMQLPLADELALRRAGLFVADKNPGLAEIWTPADEQAKVVRLRQFEWALVPAAGYLEAEGSPNTSKIKRLLRFGYRYPQRHQPYVVGRLLEAELQQNWTVAARYGDVLLYKRTR